MNTETPSSCDVVIIGAGLGGLTSAALLARAGLSVCVLEMASRPGGYLVGFRRREFTFDTAIHWLNQCGPGGSVRRVVDLIGPQAPETPPLKRIRRYKGAGFDYLLTTQPETLQEALIADFPADTSGIRRFFAAARQLADAFAGLEDRSRAPATMSGLERMRFTLGMTGTSLPFLRHLGRSAERRLPRYFKSDGLKAIFCSEATMLSCLTPISWAYNGDFQIPPEGGSQSFPAWLTQVIEDHGGTVACRCRVRQIITRGNEAEAVRFTRGREETRWDEIRCRHVVAACDVQSVYEQMLPAGTVSERLLQKLRKADLYASSVSVFLGLATPAETFDFDEELVFLTPDQGCSREEMASGDPHKTGISVMAPSIRDPSLAPEGRGTLTVSAVAPIGYANHWHTDSGLTRGEAYRTFKQEYAQVLLERVERALAPGLRKAIEVCEVATPITHLRYTGNRDGTMMGAQPTGKNIRSGLAHYRTPVRNLVLGGHWAEYGGGVPVVTRAGTNSALLILRKEKPAAFDCIKQVMDGHVSPEAGRAGWPR